MTKKDFLDKWDNNKEEVLQMEDLYVFLLEEVGVYKKEVIDPNFFINKSCGYFIFKLDDDRYFKLPYVEDRYDREYGTLEEVQRKAYSKRIEVEEWLSMPD